ncbi:hypothetical protein PV419_22960 [Streptomyces sp. ME19-01-6]|nr:hypothetical protein [Streptomyces sp. ME19-01-6]MDX3228460.1 hypothetical protein [Streptomyces sp. ME19-01-6]
MEADTTGPVLDEVVEALVPPVHGVARTAGEVPEPFLDLVPPFRCRGLVRGLLRRLDQFLLRRVDDQPQLALQLVQPAVTPLQRRDPRIVLWRTLRQGIVLAVHSGVVRVDLLPVRLGRRPRRVRVLDDRLDPLVDRAQLVGIGVQRTGGGVEIPPRGLQLQGKLLRRLLETLRTRPGPVHQRQHIQLPLPVLERPRISAELDRQIIDIGRFAVDDVTRLGTRRYALGRATLHRVPGGHAIVPFDPPSTTQPPSYNLRGFPGGS